MSIQTGVMDINVEPPTTQIALTFMGPANSSGQLCQGGTPEFEVNFGQTVPAGTPFTITDVTTGKAYSYTTSSSTNVAYVYWGNGISADCTIFGCISDNGCYYYFEASSSVSYLQTSNEVGIQIDCGCSA
jgi:hypothetical protein